jgi:DNA-binding transcriptional MerR regulator
MKIGELARLSGVAASRIRFYEASGLLRPAERQVNGYREYAPDALTRLQIILRAQGAGFTLEEIRALLPLDLDKWQHDALVQGLARKIDEIEQLERRLAQNKAGLLALLREIGERAEDGDCTGKAREVLDRMRIA